MVSKTAVMHRKYFSFVAPSGEEEST